MSPARRERRRAVREHRVQLRVVTTGPVLQPASNPLLLERQCHPVWTCPSPSAFVGAYFAGPTLSVQTPIGDQDRE
jgi:hypothetical protein